MGDLPVLLCQLVLGLAQLEVELNLLHIVFLPLHQHVPDFGSESGDLIRLIKHFLNTSLP